jgi:hypothetical protein
MTTTLSQPFYIGAETLDTDTGTYPVSIDGTEYLVDLTTDQYRQASVNVLRTRSNSQPNENLLLEPEVWRSVSETWHLGCGQRRKDGAESQDGRFLASKNIDPWTRWGISLLPSTSRVFQASAGVRPLVVDGVLVLVYGTSVRWFTALAYPLVATGTGTLPASMVDVATDGSLLYVLCSDSKVYSINLATWNGTDVPPVKVTLPAAGSLVAYLKGFLVAAVGVDLYNISGGTADSTTKFYSHPLPTHTWIAATDGLASAYLIGGRGDRWAVYRSNVKDDGTTLLPCAMAAPLPDGEIGKSLGSYLGYVLIGTDKGLRFATPAGDESLTYGPLIVSGSPVLEFEGQDRFVWFGIGGFDRDDDEPLRQPEAGLARLDLSTFTAPLLPAYASDLVARTTGDVAGVGQRVVTFKDKRVFTTAAGDVFAETGSYAAEGWLLDGTYSQDVRDEKIGLYAKVNCDSLPSGAAIVVATDPDDAGFSNVLTVHTVGAVTSSNVDLAGERWEDLGVRYTLTSGGSTTPRMTRFELRCSPRLGDATEWVLPILISRVTDWQNAVSEMDVLAEKERLISLATSGRLFWFREGTRMHRCFSPGYEWRPTSVTKDSLDMQGVMLFRLRKIR